MFSVRFITSRRTAEIAGRHRRTGRDALGALAEARIITRDPGLGGAGPRASRRVDRSAAARSNQ